MLTDDERRRALRAANPHLTGDVLAPGQALRVPLFLGDAATSGAHLKDGTMDITDSLNRLPGEYRAKTLHLMGALRSDNAFVRENAAQNAGGLIHRMKMDAGLFDTAAASFGMAMDADGKANLVRCAEYLTGMVAAARGGR